MFQFPSEASPEDGIKEIARLNYNFGAARSFQDKFPMQSPYRIRTASQLNTCTSDF